VYALRVIALAARVIHIALANRTQYKAETGTTVPVGVCHDIFAIKPRG